MAEEGQVLGIVKKQTLQVVTYIGNFPYRTDAIRTLLRI
jgi:hypothetical protein